MTGESEKKHIIILINEKEKKRNLINQPETVNY